MNIFEKLFWLSLFTLSHVDPVNRFWAKQTYFKELEVKLCLTTRIHMNNSNYLKVICTPKENLSSLDLFWIIFNNRTGYIYDREQNFYGFHMCQKYHMGHVFHVGHVVHIGILYSTVTYIRQFAYFRLVRYSMCITKFYSKYIFMGKLFSKCCMQTYTSIIMTKITE